MLGDLVMQFFKIRSMIWYLVCLPPDSPFTCTIEKVGRYLSKLDTKLTSQSFTVDYNVMKVDSLRPKDFFPPNVTLKLKNFFRDDDYGGFKNRVKLTTQFISLAKKLAVALSFQLINSCMIHFNRQSGERFRSESFFYFFIAFVVVMHL